MSKWTDRTYHKTQYVRFMTNLCTHLNTISQEPYIAQQPQLNLALKLACDTTASPQSSLHQQQYAEISHYFCSILLATSATGKPA